MSSRKLPRKMTGRQELWSSLQATSGGREKKLVFDGVLLLLSINA